MGYDDSGAGGGALRGGLGVGGWGQGCAEGGAAVENHWANKDRGAWTLPKGEYSAEEEPLVAAQREFHEETSFVPQGPFLELGSIRQRSGKIVSAWAFEGDCVPDALISNTCEIEWPPRSGRRLEIPEIDRGRWFSMHEANEYMREEQRELLRRLAESAWS